MDNKMLENKIKTAVDHVFPSDDGRFDRILSACMREDCSSMDNLTNFENTKKKKGWIKWIQIAAAIAVVAAFSAFGTVYYMNNIAVASGIVLDVNPSIEIKLNSKEKVLDVYARNADAEKILDGMDLKGTDLNVTVNALLGSMCKYGYIDSASNSILVTVEDDDAVHGAQMQQKIVDEINRILSSQSIDGAVLSQNISESNTDAAVTEIANKYGISIGKASLVHTLVTSNPLLPENELAKLSINELNLLLKSQDSAEKGGIASVGNASEQAYIGAEKAKEIALSDAGESIDSVILKEIKMDYDDGVVEYDVEFCVSGTEYEYSINASTGDIMSRETEICDSHSHAHANGPDNNQGGSNAQNGSGGNPAGGQNGQQNSGSGSSQGIDIGIEKARQTAYSHAGVPSSGVMLIKSEVDYDDGRKEYEIEFYYNGTEYDYVISTDGTVISYEHEDENNGQNSRPNSDNTAQSGDIGLEEARRLAFSHAGISESQAHDIKAETDYDDGRKEYEIEFKYAGYEYDYVLSVDGKIISYDRDRDD